MTATPTDPDAEIVITLNGTEIENGSSATWVAGRNDLKIVVDGNEESAYTVIVTAYNGSPIDVDIAGKSFTVGTPVLSEFGLEAALANHALPTMAIQFAGGSSYGGELFPIVSDLSDNKFVDAGITVAAEKAIVGQSDNDYAVSLSLIDSGTDALNPNKIIQVDESHISVPGVAIYVFEPVTGLVGGMLTESLEGWNIVRLTLDTSTFDVTDAAIEMDVDISDYLNIVPDDGNTMTVDGVGGLELYDGVIIITP